MERRRRPLPARGARLPGPPRTAENNAKSFFSATEGGLPQSGKRSRPGACVLKNSSRSAVHRHGVTIPTPVRRADRAASSKPVRFIRRWRRFTGFHARQRRVLQRSKTPSKGRPRPAFCVVHKLFTLAPIDNGRVRWYTAFSTRGEGVLKLRKEHGVWT